MPEQRDTKEPAAPCCGFFVLSRGCKKGFGHVKYTWTNMADTGRREKMFVIAGLGNPGSRYERTRHNVGFKVIERLAAKYGI